MAHISRKELKTDEVRETLAHGAEAVISHQTLTTVLLAVAILVALGVFGWRLYSERVNVKADAAYDAAMKSYGARILVPGQPPAAPGEVTFADEKSKYADAANKFAAVAAQYPRTRSGMLALYYGALSDQQIGKDEDARRLLEQLNGASDADFAAMGRFALAQVDDRTGRGDEAVKLYQQLINQPTVLVPKPVVMLSLAQHYLATDPAQAAKLYSQIKTDYPDTPIADQADQGLSLLPGKS